MIPAALLLVIAGAVAFMLLDSDVSLTADSSTLAAVKLGLFGGRVDSVKAFDARGRPIPVAYHGGRLTPRAGIVAPGQEVTVRVDVHRPGTTSWLLGSTSHERLTVTAPSSHLRRPRVTVGRSAPLPLAFDGPVHAVAYGAPGRPRRRTSADSIARHPAAGVLEVASAARPWERLGAPERLTWFPPVRGSAVVASPAAGSKVSPTTPLRLSFSKKVDQALGGAKPAISPRVRGSWEQSDDYTLTFRPSGAGVPLGTKLHVRLPRSAALVDPAGNLHSTRTVDWTVPAGSTLRLQQLLAQQGYLPLDWKPSGAPARRSLPAQVSAAVNPPRGGFSWRWPSTPSELRGMWAPGKPNDIDRGAIMAFQNAHGLQADGFAGPQLWKALLADAVKGRRRTTGYSYVYVHREASPQNLTLWHNGKTVLTTPGNTGVARAPTELGTFPVFEHLPVTTMKGTNPDGSHYSDPGIKYVSYFNGGDAVHAFDRASFGTPQSVGCVELPLAAAAKVYPYMPIGTLVTIEH